MFWVSPPPVQFVLVMALAISLWFFANFAYQVVRKPSELFFPVAHVLHKNPADTWATYAPLFKRHSTANISPEFLAALAQVEASGNPIVRTYWRWRWSSDPFEVYRPASSAVGMYQITDGTFALARKYCIRDHAVMADGPWNDWRSCWFNSLYTRILPSHAVEMTSAFLDRETSNTLRRHGLTRVSQMHRENLAALIHLCGAGAGNAYARRGLQFTAGQRCGDHSARSYIQRMNAMKAVFVRLRLTNS